MQGLPSQSENGDSRSPMRNLGGPSTTWDPRALRPRVGRPAAPGQPQPHHHGQLATPDQQHHPGAADPAAAGAAGAAADQTSASRGRSRGWGDFSIWDDVPTSPHQPFQDHSAAGPLQPFSHACGECGGEKGSQEVGGDPPASQELAEMRKQCLDYHYREMEALKEAFKEYLIELFFLQHLQGNMMDFLAFKKKHYAPLQAYLRQNDLDPEEEEEEQQSEVISDEVKILVFNYSSWKWMSWLLPPQVKFRVASS
nr:putative EP400-like protein isoform X3 [Equus asinus]